MRRVAFDYIKIDRTTTSGAIEGGTGRAALMAILAFAAESGSIVIVEGVEDASTLATIQDCSSATLYDHGPLIHSVQGYFFGLPLPAALTGATAADTQGQFSSGVA